MEKDAELKSLRSEISQKIEENFNINEAKERAVEEKDLLKVANQLSMLFKRQKMQKH